MAKVLKIAAIVVGAVAVAATGLGALAELGVGVGVGTGTLTAIGTIAGLTAPGRSLPASGAVAVA